MLNFHPMQKLTTSHAEADAAAIAPQGMASVVRQNGSERCIRLHAAPFPGTQSHLVTFDKSVKAADNVFLGRVYDAYLDQDAQLVRVSEFRRQPSHNGVVSTRPLYALAPQIKQARLCAQGARAVGLYTEEKAYVMVSAQDLEAVGLATQSNFGASKVFFHEDMNYRNDALLERRLVYEQSVRTWWDQSSPAQLFESLAVAPQLLQKYPLQSRVQQIYRAKSQNLFSSADLGECDLAMQYLAKASEADADLQTRDAQAQSAAILFKDVLEGLQSSNAYGFSLPGYDQNGTP